MRIVAGSHKGRRLLVPEGQSVRPTSDKARGALFNILRHGIDFPMEKSIAIDVFAGSGALGLEALSQGALGAVFVDKNPPSLACVRANIEALGEQERTHVIRSDSCRLPPPPALLHNAAATLVFLDPPYRDGLIEQCLESLQLRKWLAPETLCIAEMATNTLFSPPAGFSRVDERVYGAARLVFLKGS